MIVVYVFKSVKVSFTLHRIACIFESGMLYTVADRILCREKLFLIIAQRPVCRQEIVFGILTE